MPLCRATWRCSQRLAPVCSQYRERLHAYQHTLSNYALRPAVAAVVARLASAEEELHEDELLLARMDAGLYAVQQVVRKLAANMRLSHVWLLTHASILVGHSLMQLSQGPGKLLERCWLLMIH